MVTFQNLWKTKCTIEMHNNHEKTLKGYQSITPRKGAEPRLLGATFSPTIKEQISAALLRPGGRGHGKLPSSLLGAGTALLPGPHRKAPKQNRLCVGFLILEIKYQHIRRYDTVAHGQEKLFKGHEGILV